MKDKMGRTWIIVDDIDESFFCHVETVVSVVENANAVPQLGLALEREVELLRKRGQRGPLSV